MISFREKFIFNANTFQSTIRVIPIGTVTMCLITLIPCLVVHNWATGYAYMTLSTKQVSTISKTSPEFMWVKPE